MMNKQLHIEGLFAGTAELWDNILAGLRRLPNQRAQEEWLTGARPLSFVKNELTVEVPHKFAKEFMERRCRRAIEEITEDLLGRKLQIRFVAAAGSAEPERSAAETPAADARPADAPPAKPQARRPAAPSAPLSTRYRFETFATGDANQFAYAAAMAVASSPGGTYNPLFLYGGVGVGKTHLLQAIGHEIQRLHPTLRVAYVSADTFTYEFVSAIRERRTDVFRKRYRTADVWLVDDVQFIAQKESTEEEFFLTFCALQETGRQIVLASDRSPKEMHLLDSRLCSRFESGLMAELRMPNAQTRLEILRRKARAEGANVDDDVLLFVANLVQSNVRALEGALIKLLAYSSLTRTHLTCSLAHNILDGYFGKPARPVLTVDVIQRAICDYYHVDIKALKGKRRDKGIVLPRQVAMYLARQITDTPLAAIGERFGGRDHTTVLAACRKVKENLDGDRQLRAAVDELTQRLLGT